MKYLCKIQLSKSLFRIAFELYSFQLFVDYFGGTEIKTFHCDRLRTYFIPFPDIRIRERTLFDWCYSVFSELTGFPEAAL